MGSITVRRGRPLGVARPWGLSGALLLALAALGWAVARPAVQAPRALSTMRVWALGPVYTVTDVERHMAHGDWVGRTVLVQGRAALDRTWSPPDSILPLFLQWGSPDPLLASWRRLPLVGRLVPPPQRPQWGTLAVYRIQLQGRPSGFPGGDDAVLLDAAPG